VLQGDPVAFAVAVDGTPPFFYQWRRDGGPIAAATNAAYSIAATTATDDGAVFSVSVSNELGASRAATPSCASIRERR
jgi:hypothetical protein